MAPIKVNRKNDHTMTLTFDDGTNPIDITGYTVFFMVKKCYEDADADAVISKTVTSHTTPASGITTVTLTDSDTDIAVGNYVYDIRIVTDTGLTYTVIVGTFTVANIVKIGIV